MSLVVTPISARTISAWQITTATASDVQAALANVVNLGWRGKVETWVQPNSSTPVWQVTLSKGGCKDLVGGEGDWIYSDGTNVGIISATDFIARYTADTALVWDGIANYPTVTGVGGLSATVQCPLPTSPNGPFTFTLNITDNTTDTTTTSADRNESVTDKVSFTTSDLIDGHVYSFTVTCETSYEGVSATSPVSVGITAAA
jgi:hypothetical protein